MSRGVRMELSVRNMSAVAANFRAADKRLQAQVRASVKEAGEFCRGLARLLAPFRLGNLRANIKTVYSADLLSWETGWYAADFAELGLPFYPPHVERGTWKMAAQPSITPAFEETVPKFKADLAKALGDANRRAARRRRT